MRARLIKLLQLLLWQLEKLLKGSSRVPEQPFFDPADFVWTRNLEEGWPAIRRELDEAMRLAWEKRFEKVVNADKKPETI
jgi:aspartyl/asparaginyl beta-hydroxylase (cupin superfamily)